MEGVRVKQVSEAAGFSQATLINVFHSKDALLWECFEFVDRQIEHIFAGTTLREELITKDPMESIRQLWTPFYQWLVTHPDETVFYYRYRDSPKFLEFGKGWDTPCFALFLRLVAPYEKCCHVSERISYKFLWIHVLMATVLYAKYVVEGLLPNGVDTREKIFQMLTYGLQNILVKEA